MLIQCSDLTWYGFSVFSPCKASQYNFDKYAIDVVKKSNFEFFEFLIAEIKSSIKNYTPNDPLFARILSDEFYMISVLENYLKNENNNENITAFNRKR